MQNLEDLVEGLGLASGAIGRVQRSLRMLERFPLAGRVLTVRWEGTRFLIGRWPWMILYVYDEADDAVHVVAVHDARSASSATAFR